jgi:hypothetical protein
MGTPRIATCWCDAENLYKYVMSSAGSADVRIYRNLHQKCWSVQTKTAKGWRVLCHAQQFNGTQATFRVSEAGRLRTIRNRAKNVHAYCYVTLCSLSSHTVQNWTSATSYVSISYNPYHGLSSFVSTPMGTHYRPLDSTPIASARVVIGRSNGHLEGAN